MTMKVKGDETGQQIQSCVVVKDNASENKYFEQMSPWREWAMDPYERGNWVEGIVSLFFCHGKEE